MSIKRVSRTAYHEFYFIFVGSNSASGKYSIMLKRNRLYRLMQTLSEVLKAMTTATKRILLFLNYSNHAQVYLHQKYLQKLLKWQILKIFPFFVDKHIWLDYCDMR